MVPRSPWSSDPMTSSRMVRAARVIRLPEARSAVSAASASPPIHVATYRTRQPLRVVGEVETWAGHAPEVLKGMLDHLALIREQGLDVIED